VTAADIPPAPPAEIRILALGDSYTIGESVGSAERWPNRLAAMMRARGLSVAVPQIVARTGWTTDELSAGIDAAKPQGPYDVVTLLIGVNNQYRGRGLDEYRLQFRALLTRAIGLAGARPGHVVVLSVPDWGVTPFATGRDRAQIAKEIDAFNAVNRAETREAGAHYVDIVPVSRRAASDTKLTASDGLHPSAALYEEWARLVLPAVIELL
jgi:lysophospholipase L1-like esterase